MSVYFEKFLSDQQCGSRKRYSTQHCLLNLLQKWKNFVDKGKYFGALLTDLSKAFDFLDHELLTAKLSAYGFSLPALRLIHDFLSNRKNNRKKDWKIDNNDSSYIVLLYLSLIWSKIVCWFWKKKKKKSKVNLAFRKGQFVVHFFLIFSWGILFLW